MPEEMTKILSVESLSIGFGSGRRKKIILPPLNGSAMKGELIAVIGRNGIGKSTLLRTMAGLRKSIGGSVFYSGINIRDLERNDLARKAGYVSTEIINVSNMNVYDLVSLGRYPYTNWYGYIGKADNEIIMNAMHKTSIAGFSNRLLSELSDGERQKAMIARMIVQDTSIMLMDEPTAFLDIESKFSIFHLLHQLTHEEGKTIIFTTHDLQMAVSHSDKIWLINEDGLEEGAPEDLILNGDFDRLFSSSSLQFNSRTGSFSLRIEKRGSIFIEGEGNDKHWTKEAVQRAGLTISVKKTDPYIMAEPEGKWLLISSGSQIKFDSLYELLKKLSEVRINPV
jgi:iron complex transport system ATP-binding protein